MKWVVSILGLCSRAFCKMIIKNDIFKHLQCAVFYRHKEHSKQTCSIELKSTLEPVN